MGRYKRALKLLESTAVMPKEINCNEKISGSNINEKSFFCGPGALDTLHSITIERRTFHAEEKDKIRDEYRRIVAAGLEPVAERLPFWKKILRIFNLSNDLNLFEAVITGNLLVVEKTLKRLTQENSPSIAYNGKVNGMTALSLAIKAKREDIACFLIGNSNIDVVLGDDETLLNPVHHAVHLNLRRVIQKFIERGKQELNEERIIDAPDVAGMTPLCMACYICHYEIARELLNAHAMPEVCDKNGWNALFYAAQGGNHKIVKLILDSGLEKNQRDCNGVRAIDITENMGHGKATALLETYKPTLS